MQINNKKNSLAKYIRRYLANKNKDQLFQSISRDLSLVFRMVGNINKKKKYGFNNLSLLVKI